MVATAKSASSLRISDQRFLVSEDEVQQNVFPVSLTICLKQLSSVYPRNLLICLCPVGLSLQRISELLKSFMWTRACEHEASGHQKDSSNLFFMVRWSIVDTQNNALDCPLILTHKLSAGWTPVPRQTSMHSCYSLIHRAISPSWLPQWEVEFGLVLWNTTEQLVLLACVLSLKLTVLQEH